MKHDDFWRALDRLAANKGLSASGLARKAGLDPTTFNPSKRRMPDGRIRWPSTESLVKVLAATGETMATFSALLDLSIPLTKPILDHTRIAALSAPGPTRAAQKQRETIPLIGLAQAGTDGYFDDSGFPVGAAWDEIHIPDIADPTAYALRISGDSMQPLLRAGDLIIVSPQAVPRRHDRVVVRTVSGEVLAKELVRVSANMLHLRSLNPDHADRSFDIGDIAWMHRIMWVSQ